MDSNYCAHKQKQVQICCYLWRRQKGTILDKWNIIINNWYRNLKSVSCVTQKVYKFKYRYLAIIKSIGYPYTISPSAHTHTHTRAHKHIHTNTSPTACWTIEHDARCPHRQANLVCKQISIRFAVAGTAHPYIHILEMSMDVLGMIPAHIPPNADACKIVVEYCIYV